MAHIRIFLPKSVRAYVEEQVTQGGYPSLDEYVLALIQQDQQRRAQERLDDLLAEGVNSLNQGNGIEATEIWWEQERDRLVNQLKISG